MVDMYFYIVKELKDGRIMICVKLLFKQEKVVEIGCMIVGVEVIDLMKCYVKEFLK